MQTLPCVESIILLCVVQSLYMFGCCQLFLLPNPSRGRNKSHKSIQEDYVELCKAIITLVHDMTTFLAYCKPRTMLSHLLCPYHWPSIQQFQQVNAKPVATPPEHY